MNSIKFTKLDVTPLIEIDSEQIMINAVTFWKFSITDNGIGIPEKQKERIFSIFQRFHSREEL